ncbi:MAG: zinc-binding alcohol dehydrogenase family protein, partial [Acidobacteriota bacterium]|nr:zinc-binding alcohol dehydrogenase family protein [Acidobacteriota bacterium]
PSDGEVLVDGLAAGLHPRVRSGAAGAHYTSSGTLPMIPGIDGTGRLPDGRAVYFGGVRPPYGPMAQRAALRGVAAGAVSCTQELAAQKAAVAHGPGYREGWMP